MEIDKPQRHKDQLARAFMTSRTEWVLNNKTTHHVLQLPAPTMGRAQSGAITRVTQVLAVTEAGSHRPCRHFPYGLHRFRRSDHSDVAAAPSHTGPILEDSELL